MSRFKRTTIPIAVPLVAALLAGGNAYRLHSIDNAPIEWAEYTPESAAEELGRGRDVLVVVNSDGTITNLALEKECLDTPRVRRVLASSTTVPMRIWLSEAPDPKGRLSVQIWRKYRLGALPAVLLYRHDRPDTPEILRYGFREDELIAALLR